MCVCVFMFCFPRRVLSPRGQVFAGTYVSLLATGQRGRIAACPAEEVGAEAGNLQLIGGCGSWDPLNRVGLGGEALDSSCWL